MTEFFMLVFFMGQFFCNPGSFQPLLSGMKDKEDSINKNNVAST